jgi:hypothetical protein
MSRHGNVMHRKALRGYPGTMMSSLILLFEDNPEILFSQALWPNTVTYYSTLFRAYARFYIGFV